MSMLVRRGTMCHRNSTRRLQRKSQQQRAAASSIQLQGRPGSARAKSPAVVASLPATPSTSRGPLPSTSKDGLREGGGGSLYGRPWSEPTSRRSSQGFANVSVDDRRQLFSAGKFCNVESGMSAYGSIAYQMRDANMDSNSTCEFVYKALKVISKTVLMTVLLVLSMVVPVLMTIMGMHYLHECPREPNIPIYLLVGGCFGTLKMLWLICQQIRSRRYERIDDAFAEDSLDEIFTSTSYRATDVALSIFLVVWFGMGNYWVYRIYLPTFQATLLQPNDWLRLKLLRRTGLVLRLWATVPPQTLPTHSPPGSPNTTACSRTGC